MAAKLITLTFENTSNDTINNLTYKVKGNTNLILVNSTFIFDTSIDLSPYSVDIEIGNSTNSPYVIDNDADKFYLKHIIRQNYMTIDGSQYNVSQYKPNLGFYVSGDLEKIVRVVIRDSTTGLPVSNLVYYCIQFQTAQVA